MEYVIGVLLLISFFGLAVYAVRGGNLMIGMLIMGTLWLILPLIGNAFATNPEFIAAYPGVTDISFVDAMTKVYQSGPEGWGNVLVNVVFGAWFGRVLLATGIADALIRKTVELGGQISGEHGIGLGKVKFLAQAVGPVNMALMQGIKKVFDPKLILNPGKVCMTL